MRDENVGWTTAPQDGAAKYPIGEGIATGYRYVILFRAILIQKLRNKGQFLIAILAPQNRQRGTRLKFSRRTLAARKNRYGLIPSRLPRANQCHLVADFRKLLCDGNKGEFSPAIISNAW